jgi:hypothetical protein
LVRAGALQPGLGLLGLSGRFLLGSLRVFDPLLGLGRLVLGPIELLIGSAQASLGLLKRRGARVHGHSRQGVEGNADGHKGGAEQRYAAKSDTAITGLVVHDWPP